MCGTACSEWWKDLQTAIPMMKAERVAQGKDPDNLLESEMLQAQADRARRGEQWEAEQRPRETPPPAANKSTPGAPPPDDRPPPVPAESRPPPDDWPKPPEEQQLTLDDIHRGIKARGLSTEPLNGHAPEVDPVKDFKERQKAALDKAASYAAERGMDFPELTGKFIPTPNPTDDQPPDEENE